MGHWYSKTGEPRYTVQRKDGTTRESNLRDARKEKWLYSYSTIKAMAANPGIINYQLKSLNEVWWEQGERLMSLDDRTEAFRDAKKCSEEGRDSAADFGTAVHDAIEHAIKDGDPIRGDLAHFAYPALEKILEIAPRQEWEAEVVFACPEYGYGGKTDLVHRVRDLVIDIKTQKFDKEPNLYDEWAWQLAAYKVGLGMNWATCANLVISSTVPGLVVYHEWTGEQLCKAWDEFDLLRRFTFLRKNYDPTV